MHEHLILFDPECPFCHKEVKRILEIDVNKHFLFAPVHGEMSKDILSGPQKHLAQGNGLIVVENYLSTNREFWIRSQAIYRAYWLVGDGWELSGLLCFIPNFLGDFLFRKRGVHRHQFKIKIGENPIPQDRILS
jgi:predicted DCC family thiol-disulfide oxidoreductase YuxK